LKIVDANAHITTQTVHKIKAMTDNIEEHFLNKIFAGSNITPNELMQIIPRYKKMVFKKNQYLLKEGQVEKKCWFIETGFIRSYVTNTYGKDITFNLHVSGDLVMDFPSMFFFVPSRENIQALTDCVCWEIDFASFDEIFTIILNFGEQQRKLLAANYYALKDYVISLITDEAKDRYLKLLKAKPQIIQNVSLKHIATFLAITETSLSRIRKEISNE
jgi:CRP-like cAMP-binding protein